MGRGRAGPCRVPRIFSGRAGVPTNGYFGSARVRIPRYSADVVSEAIAKYPFVVHDMPRLMHCTRVSAAPMPRCIYRVVSVHATRLDDAC